MGTIVKLLATIFVVAFLVGWASKEVPAFNHSQIGKQINSITGTAKDGINTFLATLHGGSSDTSEEKKGSQNADAKGVYHPPKPTKTNNCKLQDKGTLPDRSCSPGVVRVESSLKELCTSGFTATIRDVPESLKDKVYHAYGIYHRGKGEYEIDHIISLQLGGANDFANLFPESYEIKNGAHTKDTVENSLHRQICKHKMSLAHAQKIIAVDWYDGQKYNGH